MRRVYLIISAVLLTIILNIIRATGLSLVAFHGGTSSYENWHDPMGIITFLISILVLYVCAEKLDNYGVEKEKLSVGKLDKIPFLALSLLCIFSLTTSILLPVITAMWFQPGDAMKLPDRWLLDISKKESTKIEELEIPERIQDILGYDYGSRYRINLGLGRELELYSYGYTGEDRMSSVSSYGHSPYVCIEGIGGEISHVYEPFEYAGESGVLFAVNHVQFTIDFETGEKSESDLFWIVSENNALGINPEKLSSLNYHLQWQMLKARRRDFSRHVMLAVISNSASAVKARELFKEILDEAIVLNDED